MVKTIMAQAGSLSSGRDDFNIREDSGAGLVRMQVFHRKAGAIEALCERLSIRLPDACEIGVGPGMTLLWSAPGEWFAMIAEGDECAWMTSMREKLDGLGVVLSPLVESHMVLALDGSRVMEVLARGCTIDFGAEAFAAGRCLTTRFAGITVLIARLSPAAPVIFIVERSLARYLLAWFESASVEV